MTNGEVMLIGTIIGIPLAGFLLIFFNYLKKKKIKKWYVKERNFIFGRIDTIINYGKEEKYNENDQ